MNKENITPDTREYEGRRYRLVTDEIGDNHECKRCPLHAKCHNEGSCICEDLFGEGNCIGKRLEDVTDLLTERQAYDDYQERTDKGAALMASMAEDLKDRSLTVESIVDKYVRTATPELRQQLIDRINGRGTWQDNPWVVAYTMDLQRAEGFKEQETNK